MKFSVKLMRVAFALILAWSVTARDVEAGAVGSIVHDGVKMNVEGVVAIWNPEKRQVLFVLLPFVPSAEEIELCRQGRESRIERDLVDPARWPRRNPLGSYSVTWMDPEAVGDHGKAMVLLYAFGIARENANVNMNYLMAYPEEGVEGDLTGKLEPGGEIRLVAKGADELAGDVVSWQLDIRATLVSPLAAD